MHYNNDMSKQTLITCDGGSDVNLDKCTLCKEPTPYSESTSVEYRQYYVEGAGQLCKECYSKVYNTKSGSQILFG